MKRLSAILLCGISMFGCAARTPHISFSYEGGTVPRREAIFLAGATAIHVVLDREYLIREMHIAQERDAGSLRLFQFVPSDGQSAATFGIGTGGHPFTEETIAKMHEGAKVAKIAGTIAGNSVEWWHYQDSEHVYSTTRTVLHGIDAPVYVDLVANTLARLFALENAFSKLTLESVPSNPRLQRTVASVALRAPSHARR